MNNIEKLAKQLISEVQRYSEDSRQMNNESINNDTIREDDFFEKKNREAISDNRAFSNLVKRVELLEEQLSEQDNDIVDLKETVDTIKNKADKRKDSIKDLNRRMSECEREFVRFKRKIQDLFAIVKCFGYLAGIDCNTKNKEYKAVCEKHARKERRRREKEFALIADKNMNPWKGEKK